MRKIVCAFIGGIVLVLCLIIFIVGVGDKGIGNDANSYKVDKFIIKPNDISFDSKNGGGPKIKVYITKDKKVIEMFLEEYVRGVVAAEMPAEFPIEALKAQAVAARTFALSHMDEYGSGENPKIGGADVGDTVSFQVYISKEDRLNSWPNKTKGELWNKVTEAVMSTEGQVLTFNGELVLSPYYFSTSSGRTENALDIFNIDIPYLKSVQSKGEEVSRSYKSTKKITYSEVVKSLNSSYPKAGLTTAKIKNQIKVLGNYESGSVKNIKIGNLTITGVKFRGLFGLASDNFTLQVNSKNINVVCKGYGHGVGMSQWGANVMASSGKSYEVILTHYYTGVKVEKMKY